MMKVRTVRILLLLTLLIIVVTAVYYALTPRSFFQHHMPHEHRKNTSSLFNKVSSPLSLSKTTVATWPSKESGSGLVVMANTSASFEMVSEMHRRNGAVLFTMINDAFLDFAASWCCNTAIFTNLHQRTLFLTTDVQTGEKLHSLFPNVSVVAMSSPQFSGSQEYSRAGYVRMMTERTRFILHLLEAGIPLLLFEVDCVWLADPLPLLLPRQSKVDILATQVSGKDATAGGFLFLNPTKATVQFWLQLTRMMNELFSKIKASKESAYISEALNDQEFFTRLAKKKYAGIKIEHLPSNTFPDGKWYSLPESKRQKSEPVIINNNWVVGIDAKRRRAKDFGHWFWDESKRKCDSSAVDRLFPQQIPKFVGLSAVKKRKK